ncbi:MAG TPA: helicase C-terminal domain-containing protein [Thermodesulfovibrionales bacterium]|nr:helicase C-terminal domain-containing protein [Thermodesulfovibrionales bacterium]
MAGAVSHALEAAEHLIVEAGTGVGKSLAYLIPLIERVLDGDGTDGSGRRRAVVSTYTKTLQRQLVDTELPFLRDHIFRGLRFALCLGSENYICLRRLDQAKTHGLFEMDERKTIQALLKWVKKTDTGTRSEIDLPHSVWKRVCRESDICYGKECKKFAVCFYQEAKSVERKAHILVTNHHLFFANVASGWNVIPPFDTVVFDEAHELEDVASNYLGVEVSLSGLRHFLDSLLGQQGKGLLSRLRWIPSGTHREMKDRIDLIRMRGEVFFHELSERLKDSSTLRITGKDFMENSLSEHLTDLAEALAPLLQTAEDDEEEREITALALRGEALALSLRLILEQELECHVYWAEREGKRVRLAATPIDVASILKSQVFDVLPRAVLTSATLATSGDFDYIKERLGLSGARTLLLQSPFAYHEQVALYIADHVSEPGTDEFEDELIDHIRDILRVTMGRTLVLFTSHGLMTRTYDAVSIPGLRILKQGDRDSYRLVREFKSDSHSVLFGTYTFWQGIDIPGDDLRCVIITKLPFAVPDQPVIEARIEALMRDGRDPFYHYQIPQAAILLKQGFGRLVRTKTDRGIVAILDPRIRRRRYGVRFLKSLPECRMAESLGDLEGMVSGEEGFA